MANGPAFQEHFDKAVVAVTAIFRGHVAGDSDKYRTASVDPWSVAWEFREHWQVKIHGYRLLQRTLVQIRYSGRMWNWEWHASDELQPLPSDIAAAIGDALVYCARQERGGSDIPATPPAAKPRPRTRRLVLG